MFPDPDPNARNNTVSRALTACHILPRDPKKSRFLAAYCAIREAAREYRIVDCHDVPPGHYEIDFNREGSVAALRDALFAYRPEVILCMETLEHVNYRYEMMNAMATAVSEWGATVFITIPNNGNWIFNALGWNWDHSVAFFENIARRFVFRSNLGQHAVDMLPCFQKYLPCWWLVYAAAFFQPFSWGFVVRPRPPLVGQAS
jgi:hypothetical protein